MFPIWTQVIVNDEDSHRHNTAGYVVGINAMLPDQRIVRFDLDGTDEAMDVDQLRAL